MGAEVAAELNRGSLIACRASMKSAKNSSLFNVLALYKILIRLTTSNIMAFAVRSKEQGIRR